MGENNISHWKHEEINPEHQWKRVDDVETSGIPRRARAATLKTSEWGQNSGTDLRKFPAGPCRYYQFPKMWLEVLEAWYFRQAGMGVVLGAQFYTRQVGRIRSTKITAARGNE